MKRKLKVLGSIFILILIIFFTRNGENKVKYNNEKRFDELITYKYQADEFITIMEILLNNKNINLFEIVSDENIECARHIESTRYLILLSEENEKLFIFFDSNYIVTDSFYVKSNCLERSAFENVQVGKTRLSEIKKIDGNFFVSPISAVESTIHIVKEGILIFTYNRVQNISILKDPIVESVKFYTNEEILNEKEKNILIKVVPYILPIDK